MRQSSAVRVIDTQSTPSPINPQEEEKMRKSRLENATRLCEGFARHGVAAAPLHQQMYARFEAALDQGQDPRYQLGFDFMSVDEKNQLIFKWVDKQQDIARAQQKAQFEQEQALAQAEAQRQAALRQQRLEAIQQLSSAGPVIQNLLRMMSNAFADGDENAAILLAKEAAEGLWVPCHAILNGMASQIEQAEVGLLGWPLEMMEQLLITLNGLNAPTPDIINFREGLEACLKPIAAACQGWMAPSSATPVSMATATTTQQPTTAAPDHNSVTIPPSTTEHTPSAFSAAAAAAAAAAQPATNSFANALAGLNSPPPVAPKPANAFQQDGPGNPLQQTKPSAGLSATAIANDKTSLIRKMDSDVGILGTFVNNVDQRAKAKSGLQTKLCDQISVILQVPLVRIQKNPAITFDDGEAGKFGKRVVDLLAAMNRVVKIKQDQRFNELKVEVEQVVMLLNP